MSDEYKPVKSEELEGEDLESAFAMLTERERVRPPPEGEIETVFGKDDRKEVTDTTALPWRHICSLTIEMPKTTLVGTGWLISPSTVITAGHCLYELDRGGGKAKSIRVIPGRCGDVAPFDPADGQVARKFEVLDGWVEGQNAHQAYSRIHAYDYGAIFLDEPFEGLGCFSFAAIADRRLSEAQNVNIAGYPSQDDGSDKDGRHLFWHARRIDKVEDTILRYETDTYGGQSGSPIWMKSGRTRVVVGIHTRGETATDAFNAGVRINEDVFAVLKRWKRLGE